MPRKKKIKRETLADIKADFVAVEDPTPTVREDLTEFTPEPAPTGPSTKVDLGSEPPDIWATRDAVDGVLANVCSLWIERPTRHDSRTEGGDVMWLATGSMDQEYLGPYTLEAVRRWCGTIPETHRECIRKEGFDRGPFN